jgi:hypothetical protein
VGLTQDQRLLVPDGLYETSCGTCGGQLTFTAGEFVHRRPPATAHPVVLVPAGTTGDVTVTPPDLDLLPDVQIDGADELVCDACGEEILPAAASSDLEYFHAQSYAYDGPWHEARPAFGVLEPLEDPNPPDW